jgi:histone deacetylase 6
MVLKNLFVQGQIEKLGEQMTKREQLADGLALVDFEQLKIENSTLAEKIDERNEEISKLRRKTTTAVQTITHLREKLHFVNADVARLQSELSATEKQVGEQRRSLGFAKKDREQTRADTEKARNMQGFAYNDSLAIDYELRKRNVHVLKSELLQQMKRYEDLQSFTNSIMM